MVIRAVRRGSNRAGILGGIVPGSEVPLHEAKLKAQKTYNAAADFFDDPALGFWERFGRTTVERLDLTPGESVLDVCAGTGASAIPAAQIVGPTGRVVAVDLAENLLALADQKARRLGLANIEIRHSDVDALDYPAEYFDAVVIVFGIFFLPDMTAATSGLWRFVKPGGHLAVTTWGPDLWEPASSLFWSAVEGVRPDLTRAYNPWDSLVEPDAVRGLLFNAGTTDIRVDAVSGVHALQSPDDFWTIVLGSGLRATYDAMTAEEQEAVRSHVTEAIAERGISDVQVNVVYANATKVRSRAA
jgi:ubiquinone/menaquinone biosynthesis C-methylase UbiE